MQSLPGRARTRGRHSRPILSAPRDVRRHEALPSLLDACAAGLTRAGGHQHAQRLRWHDVAGTFLGNGGELVAGGAWRYLDNGTDPGAAWRSNQFNDATWRSGPARLGFGGDGEVTTLARTNANGTTNITFYFRRAFYVGNPAEVLSLQGRLVRDDGAVIYVNGAEVWRDSMPAGSPGHLTLASATINGAGETNWLTNALSPAALVAGWNTPAAEVHQVGTTSSDAGFNFELTGTVIVPELPGLSLLLQPSTVNVSWPQEASYFNLHGTTNLAPPVTWLPVTNAAVLTNGEWRVVLPTATHGARFYRLQAP